jgi:hypothetical protein
MIEKPTVEVATMAPSPAATAAACRTAPAKFPATVVTAAWRPYVKPRLTANSTLGPGTTSRATAVSRKLRSCVLVMGYSSFT